ncbi:Coiled-coil domain-containing protein R3HCC1L [Dirofilaria immitis]
MSSNLKFRKSVQKPELEYVDSNGNHIDLSEAVWMVKVTLPYIDIQEIYRKIQDEAVRNFLPHGTKSLLRVNCTNNTLDWDDFS